MEFLVTKDNSYKRVDIYLSKKITHLTRSYIKKLIEKGLVKINKKAIYASSTKIKPKDEINVDISNKINKVLLPKKINLNIIYEDKDLAIINKPKGMVVHPGAGNTENTLANALSYKYNNKLSDINGDLRPGIVHRIDKDTSGLLVIAKNNLSHARLGEQFSKHSIKRTYQCLVWGVIRPLKGRIETLISRNKKNRQLMTVSEIKGKKAITNYKTLKVFNIKDIPKISLVECELETGRTHQIRVHFKYKKTSILGDIKYGKRNKKFKKVNKDFYEIFKDIKGQILHAQTLEFVHPSKNKLVKFQSKLPRDFTNLLDLLKDLSS